MGIRRRGRPIRVLLLLAVVLLVPPCLPWLLFALSDLPPLPVMPQQDQELRHMTLVSLARPGESAPPSHRRGVSIQISGGRIASIKDDPIEGEPDGYVLPGLIDAHVHSPLLPGDHRLWATLYLLHGITSVRNLGDGSQSLRRKIEVAAGREAGPRIFSCGVHLDGDRDARGGGFLSRTIRTPADATAAVKELKRGGADCIKVMPHFSLETFTALRTAAQEANLPLVGHMVNSYGDRGLEESGLADVQHLTGVPTVPSPGFDSAEWLRFHQGLVALTPERLAQSVAVSRRLGIVHTPTLVSAAYEAHRATEAGQRGQSSDDSDGLDPHLELLPPWYGRFWDSIERARPVETRTLAAGTLRRSIETVRALHQAGVTVQAGSDVFPFIPYVVPGAGLHDELRLFTRAGFSNEEALAAATTVPGTMLARTSGLTGLGSVVEGGPADLLIFSRDPTTSLADLNSLKRVIVDGRRYERAELQRHLDRQLLAAEGLSYSWSARLLGWLFSLFA